MWWTPEKGAVVKGLGQKVEQPQLQSVPYFSKSLQPSEQVPSCNIWDLWKERAQEGVLWDCLVWPGPTPCHGQGSRARPCKPDKAKQILGQGTRKAQDKKASAEIRVCRFLCGHASTSSAEAPCWKLVQTVFILNIWGQAHKVLKQVANDKYVSSSTCARALLDRSLTSWKQAQLKELTEYCSYGFSCPLKEVFCFSELFKLPSTSLAVVFPEKVISPLQCLWRLGQWYAGDLTSHGYV